MVSLLSFTCIFVLSKITQYSPSETAKVYEKAVNRKSNAKFNPKATLQKIKQGSLTGRLDQEAKKALVSDYLEVSNPVLLFLFNTTHIVQHPNLINKFIQISSVPVYEIFAVIYRFWYFCQEGMGYRELIHNSLV